MIPFHRFLIGTAIVFCGGLAVWMFSAYRAGGDTILLVLAVAFAIGAAALSYYLAHLSRFLRGRPSTHE